MASTGRDVTSELVLSDIDRSEDQILQILMALNKGIHKQQTRLKPEDQAFQEVLLLSYAAGPQPPRLPQPMSVYVLQPHTGCLMDTKQLLWPPDIRSASHAGSIKIKGLSFSVFYF